MIVTQFVATNTRTNFLRTKRNTATKLSMKLSTRFVATKKTKWGGERRAATPPHPLP